jgi:glycosyltransferase involved in cell wall biosynthesis
MQKVKTLDLSDNVLFTGKLPHSEILSLYQIADVVIFPSIVDSSGFEEGFPMVVIESLASGKAVVAASTSGVKEIIEHGVNGLLVDQKNADQIALEVIHLIENPDIKKTIEKNAQNSALKYDWENICTDIEKVISIVRK